MSHFKNMFVVGLVAISLSALGAPVAELLRALAFLAVGLGAALLVVGAGELASTAFGGGVALLVAATGLPILGSLLGNGLRDPRVTGLLCAGGGLALAVGAVILIGKYLAEHPPEPPARRPVTRERLADARPTPLAPLVTASEDEGDDDLGILRGSRRGR